VFYLFCVVHGVSDGFLYMGGFTAVAIAVAVVILAVLESTWSGARFLRLRLLRTVSRVSYGVYIWHLAIFVAVARYTHHWAPAIRLLFALSLAALACSGSWVLVERPFLRWKDRKAHRTNSRMRTCPSIRSTVVTDRIQQAGTRGSGVRGS
jgi:peptidoglycan/LPS O-acetylase OafA/YrhL